MFSALGNFTILLYRSSFISTTINEIQIYKIHRILVWFELEGTLKIIKVQLPLP